MAVEYKDRVQEITTSTGTGNVTLAGAVAGYRTFNDAHGVGPQFAYCIDGGSEWEVGLTVLSGSTTLVRGGSQTVLASSNSGSAVNFSAGTKYIFSTTPAAGFPLISNLTSDVVYNADATLGDTGISITLVSGAKYRIRASLHSLSANNTRLLTDFAGTATFTQFRGNWSARGNTFPYDAYISSPGDDFGGSGDFNGAPTEYEFSGIAIVNAGGTLTVRGCQETSEAFDLTLYAPSWLEAFRL